MGVAASVLGNDGASMWSPQEAVENAKSIEIQQMLTGFVSTHFFGGLPTRAGKQSEDPLSSLWIEVSLEILAELEAHDDGLKRYDKVSTDFIESRPESNANRHKPLIIAESLEVSTKWSSH